MDAREIAQEQVLRSRFDGMDEILCGAGVIFANALVESTIYKKRLLPTYILTVLRFCDQIQFGHPLLSDCHNPIRQAKDTLFISKHTCWEDQLSCASSPS